MDAQIQHSEPTPFTLLSGPLILDALEISGYLREQFPPWQFSRLPKILHCRHAHHSLILSPPDLPLIPVGPNLGDVIWLRHYSHWQLLAIRFGFIGFSWYKMEEVPSWNSCCWGTATQLPLHLVRFTPCSNMPLKNALTASHPKTATKKKA